MSCTVYCLQDCFCRCVDSNIICYEKYIIGSKNEKSCQNSCIIVKFFHTGEIDYNIVRLSDIAMTCYASSKSASTANPFDKVFDIDLLDAQGNKVTGITNDSKKAFLEFNAALEEFAPYIQLNVPMKEIKQLRSVP